MKMFSGQKDEKKRWIFLARFMCQQEQMSGVIQKQEPEMGLKLELFMSNSRCFYWLSEEEEYQAELTHITENKTV